MKSISTTAAKDDLDGVLGAAQKERILLTRNGKPSAVLVGVECYDAEDWHLVTSPEFWQMISERRKGPSITLEELKARLGHEHPGPGARKSTKSKKTTRQRRSPKDR